MVILEAEHSLIIFFSGIKLNPYYTHEPSCLVFAMFPYPVINCQGFSNLFGLLAVLRSNELETALIYNNKKKTYSRLFKWVIFIAFGC